MEAEQMSLVRTSTPELRAQLATQRALIQHQLKNPPTELPIDKDAEHEAQRTKTDPNAKKPQSESQPQSQVIMTRRHRGGAPRVIPKGSTCAFPTASERQGNETREFEEGELVCLQNETETSKELAVYLRTEGNQHIVKTGDAEELSVVWWRIGKYTAEQLPGFMDSFYSTIGLSNAAPSGTGAAGQGMATGSQSGPYLFPPRSDAYGVSGKGRSKRRKLKSKKRTTRRR